MPSLPSWVQWVAILAAVASVAAWLLTNAIVLYFLCVGLWLILLGAVLVNRGVGGPVLNALAENVQRAVASVLMSPTPAPTGSNSMNPASGSPHAPKPAVNRRSALEEGQKAIEELEGLGGVRRALEDLFDAEEHATSARMRMAELSRATLFIFSGPNGSGRTTVTDNLTRMFYGKGHLSHPSPINFPMDMGRARSPSELYLYFRQEGENWRNRMVVFKDAEWLTAPDAAAVGRALSEVANAYPGELWITLIGGSSLGRQLRTNPETQTAWSKFSIREVLFPTLSDESAKNLLSRYISKRGNAWEDLAKQAFIGIISRERSSPTFANAVTAIKLFEYACQVASVRLRGSSNVIVTKADVEQAAENL